MNEVTRVLTRSDVERLLDVPSCVAAVENAFVIKGRGLPSTSGVLGVHVTGGGFHAKAAHLELTRPYFVVKVNANFPGNPAAHGLPTIQGVLTLFDATRGVPLAVMDSMAITTLRTAAASAVAARYLARADARSATFIGCGVQAKAHVAALRTVRPLDTIHLFDIDRRKAEHLASDLRAGGVSRVRVVDDVRAATRASDIIVTSTSATTPFLGVADVSPGTFVAAIGADNEHKSEIEPALMRECDIVVDDLEQCATIGDLHHAIAAGAATRDRVHATLGAVIAGITQGRRRDDAIIVFDSTGVAIEDVAAAAVVYERAARENLGMSVRLGA